MGNLILNGITPGSGKIKLGSQNVNKIYAGTTLVWGGSFNENLGTSFSDLRSIKINTNGDIFIGGFQLTNNLIASDNISYRNVAKLSANGVVNTTFAANTLNNFDFFNDFRNSTFALHPDGESIILSGRGYASDGTENYKILKINNDGTLDTAFNDNAEFTGSSESTDAICISVLGTDIYTYVSGPGGGLMKFNQQGLRDLSFISPQFANGDVTEILPLADGSILTGGSFANVDGLANTRHLAKINSNGTVDVNFASNWGNIIPLTPEAYAVSSIAVGLDNSIFIGGSFESVPITTPNSGVVYRNYIIKLNSDGTINPDFSSNMGTLYSSGLDTTGVYRIRIVPDETGTDYKVLMGGSFNRWNIDTVNKYPFFMARVQSDGSIDNTFYVNTSISFSDNRGFDDQVRDFYLQDDGKIVVVGYFSEVQGQDRSKIVRLTSDGYID